LVICSILSRDPSGVRSRGSSMMRISSCRIDAGSELQVAHFLGISAVRSEQNSWTGTRVNLLILQRYNQCYTSRYGTLCRPPKRKYERKVREEADPSLLHQQRRKRPSPGPALHPSKPPAGLSGTPAAQDDTHPGGLMLARGRIVTR
jgi:hypothetical protein